MAIKLESIINVAARIVGISILISLLVYVYPRFYSSLLETPNYSLLDEFKGGKTIGFRYAYVGAWMLIISQVYVFLKYLIRHSRIRVRLAKWLDIHCILNTTGFTLIIIHSGFPYYFRYWEPFTRINVFKGLEGLISIRGLLTWILLLTFTSGFLSRYGSNLKLKRISNRVHFYSVLAAYALACIHILLSIMFPETK